jgi:hypothetical protein
MLCRIVQPTPTFGHLPIGAPKYRRWRCYQATRNFLKRHQSVNLLLAVSIT